MHELNIAMPTISLSGKNVIAADILSALGSNYLDVVVSTFLSAEGIASVAATSLSRLVVKTREQVSASRRVRPGGYLAVRNSSQDTRMHDSDDEEEFVLVSG